MWGRLLTLTATLGLSGCASIANVPSDRIPTHVIIDSLKCDLAKYFVYEHQHRGPPFIIQGGSPVETTLTLNVVNEELTKGSAGFEPTVLAFAGGKLGLGISESVKRTSTTEQTVVVKFTPTASNLSICHLAGRDQMAGGVGVYDWLTSARKDINHEKRGPPLALIDKLTYSTSFAVERTHDLSGDFEFLFVPLKLSADESRTRTDTQKIEVTVVTKKQQPKSKPKRKCDPSKGESCPLGDKNENIERYKQRKCDPQKETCPLIKPQIDR